jgi:hypothetical protein
VGACFAKRLYHIKEVESASRALSCHQSLLQSLLSNGATRQSVEKHDMLHDNSAGPSDSQKYQNGCEAMLPTVIKYAEAANSMSL